MPTAEQMRAAVDGYIAGFASGDPANVSALFAEDATVEDPVGTPLKRGREEIHAFYDYSLRTGAKLELTGDPRIAADHVAFPFRVLLDWEGKRQTIEVIDTFRIDDEGKIAEMRAFWGPDNMKAG